jgi:hypothetical protein
MGWHFRFVPIADIPRRLGAAFDATLSVETAGIAQRAISLKDNEKYIGAE